MKDLVEREGRRKKKGKNKGRSIMIMIIGHEYRYNCAHIREKHPNMVQEEEEYHDFSSTKTPVLSACLPVYPSK